MEMRILELFPNVFFKILHKALGLMFVFCRYESILDGVISPTAVN
jgi:hypothetical protein